MPTSTLKKQYDSREACHTWHASLLFLLLGMLAACSQKGNVATALARAELCANHDSARAAELYRALPDSTPSVVSFKCLHTKQCLTNFYFRKAACALADHDVEKAAQMFGKFVETNTAIHYNDAQNVAQLKQSASVLLALEEAKGTAPDDSMRQALMSRMMEVRPETVNHRPETNLLSMQQRFTHHKLYVPLLLLLTVILASLLHYERQSERFALRMSERKAQQQQLSERIDHLQTQVAESENEIAHLASLNSKMQETTNHNLGLGKKIFDFVEAGGHMKNISIADEQCFIDYYAFTHPDDYLRITSPFSSLTLRHTTYLILTQLGHSDADIQRILFVQPSTIRNYRLRMKHNRKA